MAVDARAASVEAARAIAGLARATAGADVVAAAYEVRRLELEAVMAGGGRGEVRGAEVMGTVATVAATAEEATVAVALVVTARAAATEAVVQPAVDAMAG